MLILIVGITGNIGLKLAGALMQRGHSVRGASRSSSKLPDSILENEKLENFLETSSWYDVETLRKAVKGVDAAVCAYSPIPALALEAELLLVRIMEEEGVRVRNIIHIEFTIANSNALEIYTVYLEP